MRRTSGNNAVCFDSLEKALEERPETYGRIDLIAFGFPCQDISAANPKGKGLSGEKSSIFFECIRIVRLLAPRWLLIENVPRLLSINGGRDFAIVLRTLAKCGYGYSWNILDSQYFGVAQRRKRLFIGGHLGGFCPPEILSEPKDNQGNNQKVRKILQKRVSLALRTNTGQSYNHTADTYIASTIQATDYRKVQHGQFGNEGNLIASTIQKTDAKLRKIGFGENLIAGSISTQRRGNCKYIWQDNYIAETHPTGERAPTGIPRGLDSARGIVLGNAVTVPVAEWIGRRMIEWDEAKSYAHS